MKDKFSPTKTIKFPVWDVEPGRIIDDKYRIQELIGRGGMGIVYKAEDIKLKRSVALKFLPPEMTQDSDARVRFVQEARAASSLDHNNICTIHEIGETKKGQVFICMTYYEGESLREKLKKKPLTLEEAVKVVEQIGLGLTKAHKKGIVHRDIKPANIFITVDGVPKILDFGLAKLGGEARLTRTGTTMGTVAYMSPQQAKGEEVDHKTDMWSLGVVFYEMITGKTPFPGHNEQSVLYSILNVDPAPIDLDDKNVLEKVSAILKRSLEKDQNKRYQNITEFLKDIESLKKDTPLGIYVPRKSRKIKWSTLSSIFIGTLITLILFTPLQNPIKKWLGISQLASVKHLAVIPLTNIGENPATQPYCDGLAEILSSKLTQLEKYQKTLWVVPFSEVRRYKIQSASEAKQNFEVTLAVTGSIQREGDHIILTLNLVDTKSLRQLDSIMLDENITNLSALQRGVVSRLAEMMDLEIKPETLPELAAGETAKPRAYDYYVRGRGYLQNYIEIENINSAIHLFERAIEEDKNYAMAYSGLADAYLRKFYVTNDAGWIQKAKEYCLKALEIDDTIIEPLNVSLEIYLTSGEYDQAIARARHIIEKDPENTRAYIGLASAYENTGLAKEAEANYKKALQVKPGSWGTHNALANFYMNQGRYEEAEKLYLRLLDLAPDNIWGYANLTAVYFYMERWEEAKETSLKALKIKPHYRGYANLALIYFYEKDYEKAAEMYEKALEISDKDYRVWNYLSMCYSMIPGAEEKEIACKKKALELAKKNYEQNPKDHWVILEIAGLYQSLGDNPNALKFINHLIDLNPTDLQILGGIGEFFEGIKDRESALKWFEKCFEKGVAPATTMNNPSFADLRSDERFQALLKKYGLKKE